MPPPGSSAAYVAGKVVRHVHFFKTIKDIKICCIACNMLAIQPVTGRCGHTRCSSCVMRIRRCICGEEPSQKLNSNILVRDIIEKMQYRRPLPKLRVSSLNHADDTKFTVLPTSPGRVLKYAMRSRLRKKPYKGYIAHTWTRDLPLRRMATTPDYRMEYARNLLYYGRYRDAAAHLAQVAASSEHNARIARDLLVKVIATLCPSDPRRLIRNLYQSVRFELATAWIDDATIECPVCYNNLDQPVTTTCGHTFCRHCIKRTLKDRKLCPLCSSNLNDFHLAQTETTEMVSAMLSAITDKPAIDPELTPLFACTVAFPDIPCPLMIFDAEFRKVVRNVLDMGLRRFGMLASLGDDTYTNYGTIVDVRDYIEFENGNSILSTVGVSRFRIIDKMTINGCPYARVQNHTDIIPSTQMSISYLQLLGQQIKQKAQEWLPSLDEALRMDIGAHFGPFPEMSLEGEWWRNPNGPCWLWWLIAILPLRTEIQMLMLSTKHLSKRMTAVLRTLDAMASYTKEGE